MTDTPAIVRYTNWRGETTERRLILGDVRFGTTEWHPKPTWLINAFDLDHPVQIWKEFDLLQCDFTLRADPTQDERVKALVAWLAHEENLCRASGDRAGVIAYGRVLAKVSALRALERG